MKKMVSVLLVLALCVTTMLVPDVGAAAKLSVTKSITLGVGKSKNIKVKGAYVKSKKFKTTNKNVATVNKNGKVTAKQAGKCRITVTVKYKKAKTYVTKTFKCNVTVMLKQKREREKMDEPERIDKPKETNANGSEEMKTSGDSQMPEAPLPSATAAPAETILPHEKPVPAETQAPDDSIYNPSVSSESAEWDLVEYGKYPQSLYTPLTPPEKPVHNERYVDSDGTQYICQKEETTTTEMVLNEETQKYEEVVSTQTEYYYYKVEPILWRVLSVDDNTAFLLADKNLDCKVYNDVYEGTSWEKCSLRKWLNDKFKNKAFSEDEQKAIANTYVYSRGNPQSVSTSAGDNTYDDIFVLDIYEASKKEYGFGVDEEICGVDGYGNAKSNTRIATCTDYTLSFGDDAHEGKSDWWLRSPGKSTHYGTTVFYFGSINYSVRTSEYVSYGNGVRPAFCIDMGKTSLKRVGCVDSDGKYTMFR